MQHIGKSFIYSLAIGTLVLLTGCGGAGTTEEIPPVSSDKPTESSSLNAASTSSSNSTLVLSSISELSSSSKSQSSIRLSSSSTTTSAYQRTSRESSSTPSIDDIDITAPSKTKLFPYKFGISSLTITWDHATDDMGINAYQIARNGEVVATLEYPSFVYADKGLTPNTSYAYTIRAVDTSGNIAEESDVLTSRTLAVNGTTSSIAKSSSVSSAVSSLISSFRSSISSQPTSSKSSQNNSSLASSNNPQTSSSGQSSIPSSSGMASSSASSNASTEPAVITLQWEHPTQRVNEEYLDFGEIAGYELRRKNILTQQVIFLVIEGNLQKEFTIFDPVQNEVIDIAVYDTEGRYSDFVRIYPK